MSWRRRGARIAVVAAVCLIAVQWFPAFPQDQPLSIELAEPSQIKAVELRWSDGDGDPLGGVTYNYRPGTAPSLLRHTVEVPNGDYTLSVRVRRSGKATSEVRRVTLTGDPVRIDLRSMEQHP